jgi:hypothetical protein
LKTTFWNDPDFPLFAFLLGLFFSFPSAYLSYYAATDKGMAPAAVLLSIIGGVMLGFLAATFLVYVLWVFCCARISMIEEIREFLPNYTPITMAERILRRFDYRKFGRKDDLLWRN